MSTTYISVGLRRVAFERAERLCEYCLIHEEDTFFGCEVDHIISEKHGGPTEEANLAIACLFCNRNKGSDIASVVPGSDRLVRFFNPRTDPWSEHFRLGLDGITIVPLTELGEATVPMPTDFQASSELPICPACQSPRVAWGVLQEQNSEWRPTLQLYNLHVRWFRFYPHLTADKNAGFCVTCGHLWSFVDPAAARKQIHKYGSAELKARILEARESPTCPACQSPAVALGVLQRWNGDVIPTLQLSDLHVGLFRADPKLTPNKKARLCVACGHLWSYADPAAARLQIRKFGSAKLKARLLEAGETLPRPATAIATDDSDRPIPSSHDDSL